MRREKELKSGKGRELIWQKVNEAQMIARNMSKGYRIAGGSFNLAGATNTVA